LLETNHSKIIRVPDPALASGICNWAQKQISYSEQSSFSVKCLSNLQLDSLQLVLHIMGVLIFELGLQTFYPGGYCVQTHTKRGGVPCNIYQDAILPRPYQAVIQSHPTMDAIHFIHDL